MRWNMTSKLALWRFVLVSRITAWLARRAYLANLTQWVMQRLADVTIAERSLRPKTDLKSIAEEWQRAFPKNHPIVEASDDTIVAEIPSYCALRGTGDVAACWRMMEYDRSLLRQIGGEFAVLESQAAGGSRCRVAIRAKGAGFSDLQQAHERDSK